ncbi:MAG: alpha/beta hydrolase, partial [Bryobacteraceae bacterium]
KNIAQYSGDPHRIYVAGHSSGANIAARLALDPANRIRGAILLSGAYKEAVKNIHAHAPPFLIAYCQWDGFGLPLEAREFADALKKRFVGVQVFYLPGENHVSEIASISGADDPAARAILSFIR